MGPFPVSSIVAAITLCVCLAQSGFAEELSSAFAKQYPLAAEKLAQAYRHATIKGTHTLEFPQTGGTNRQVDIVYRVDGQRVRLDQPRVVYYKNEAPTGSIASRFLLVTAEKALWGDKWEKDDRFELGELEAETCHSYIRCIILVDWIYAYGSLLKSLNAPDANPTFVEQTTVDGQTLLNVGYCWTTDSALGNGEIVNWRAEYLLSPAENWAVREVRTTSASNGELGRFLLRIEYDGLQDGVPRAKRIVEECCNGPNFKVNQRRTTEISQIVFTAPEERFFTSDNP